MEDSDGSPDSLGLNSSGKGDVWLSLFLLFFSFLEY